MSIFYVDSLDAIIEVPTVAGSAGSEPADYVNNAILSAYLVGAGTTVHPYGTLTNVLSIGSGQTEWGVRLIMAGSYVTLTWESVAFAGEGSAVAVFCDLGSYAPASSFFAPIQYDTLSGQTPVPHVGYMSFVTDTITIYSDTYSGVFASYNNGSGEYRIMAGSIQWLYVAP